MHKFIGVLGGKGVLICHYFMIFISDARLFALALYWHRHHIVAKKKSFSIRIPNNAYRSRDSFLYLEQLHAVKTTASVLTGTIGRIVTGMLEIMDKAQCARGCWRVRGAKAWWEHPIQFWTGAGSLYKHKGLITCAFLWKDEERKTAGARGGRGLRWNKEISGGHRWANSRTTKNKKWPKKELRKDPLVCCGEERRFNNSGVTNTLY